jgi:hypothetical protein
MLTAFRRSAVRVFVPAILLVAASSAQATTDLDLKVGFKTLPLLLNKLSGTVPMAVLFDPAQPASKAEADQVVALAGGGLQAPGGVTVTAVAVPVTDLSKHPDAKLAFVTSGLGKSWDAVQQSATGVLTMTTDLDCVKADKCVLGIVSAPSVAIYYSKPSSDAQKVGFSDAFAMLAKKF